MIKFLLCNTIVILLLCSACSSGTEAPSVTPTPSPTVAPTPTVTPSPTPMPTPTPVPTPIHPDLEKHYISRLEIEGYENMSESHIQELLDMYDYGYEDCEEYYEFEVHERSYDMGKESGYYDGYEEGYDEGYYDGYDEGYYDGIEGNSNYYDEYYEEDNDPSRYGWR